MSNEKAGGDGKGVTDRWQRPTAPRRVQVLGSSSVRLTKSPRFKTAERLTVKQELKTRGAQQSEEAK